MTWTTELSKFLIYIGFALMLFVPLNASVTVRLVFSNKVGKSMHIKQIEGLKKRKPVEGQNMGLNKHNRAVRTNLK